MNPSLGVMLIGAVQHTWIVFLLISIVLPQYRRKRQYHGLFTCEMVFWWLLHQMVSIFDASFRGMSFNLIWERSVHCKSYLSNWGDGKLDFCRVISPLELFSRRLCLGITGEIVWEVKAVANMHETKAEMVKQ
ncbi:hypothetical protein HHK36_001353 [Tetracentron sinense]|uniref:Uncharacterized protein n=1 Tax=Tetracentron sinense TaxID=13715 RepID=A0A835DUY2_TETSI|nr:hypothetical protein HHK36_001353 [Tetracentron sinense]